MYLFFLIFGIIFILAAGIFINYIYEFFPINKITNFIYSTKNTPVQTPELSVQGYF